MASRWIFVPVVAFGALACSSSSGSGSSIVGEWSTPQPNGTSTEEWFFNSNGSCGLILQNGNLSICASTGCTYTFNGSTLTLTTSSTSGGVTTSTTYTETITFTNGGSSATVTQAGDAGTGTTATYTRVNANDGTSCP